ncbi:type II toxin-antitoxin system antitoxin SocA domain-containing protein [Melissococcus plutonius]|uniref:type II toxin-antitoxin system antitoxin SocA domain-containing protein n=1 Tax=Melissococcus plutonius TaxID=33970 RepID=UPI0021E5C34F|nr:hypothetical protein [Melissococcus plutonius]MCV2506038.1 hypothetical protein [Melissococcus plutonius]MCV2518863.1 hypothetical protein [Melissococcus plutonius]MCV2528094.1 hypothetical protein [Melissococcus plutonius]
MLNTSKRRLYLSAWFFKNNPKEFFASLKLQKFLFFYEMFNYSLDNKINLDYLKGYKNGPVYSDVYGDYTYRMEEFQIKIEKIINEAKSKITTNVFEQINEDVAKKAAFLVSILSKSELSELSHEFDIWKNKQMRIEFGEKQVELKLEDLSPKDKSLAKELYDLYSMEFINSSSVISVNETKFIIDKNQRALVTDELEEVLEEISKEEESNPIYISIEDGVIVVDD